MQPQPDIGSPANLAPAPQLRAPALRIHWTPWYRVFVGNLADLLLRRQPAPARITALPAEFWPDVFVARGLPWRTLMESALYHSCLVAALWTASVIWPTVPRTAQLRNPFDNTTLTYYSVSEYLPEIDSGTSEPPKERKGEPAFAKQKIISLPPSPDNFRQTIITPSNIKLPQDAALPNIVAWTPVPALMPEAAMNRARLTAPAPTVTPVAPPPDPTQANTRRAALPAPDVVQPAADPNAARAKVNLPNVPGPEVIGPPPSLDSARAKVNAPSLPEPVVGPAVSGENARPIGAMNMARADLAVAAPQLPVAEQRPARVLRPGDGAHGSGGAGQPNVAPSPSVVAGASAGKQDVGQLIALSINPAPVTGPIKVPVGSRHGEFAAGPEGKPGAPGTPDVRGTNGTNGVAHGNAGGPPGISVSPGPTPVPPGPVVAANPANAPAPAVKPKSTLLASLGSSRVSDLARATRPGVSVNAPEKVDDGVFAGKKYYSMVLNMPNMTSAGGSWIIRFAELHQTRAGGDLTAPVATLKVDPAYPAEAMRSRLEGTVAVYAVIRRDGSVAEVRVLHGVDEKLDENAKVAVSHWQFRPATKDGEAVDLEAVFHVPFVARRSPF